MNLKSFGCSFIFGSELPDSIITPPNLIPSKLTWPSHLANYLGYDYSCYARPGAGNLYILEQILDQANSNDSVFVISWTWIDRFDYCYFEPDMPGKNPWRALRPEDPSSTAKVYYKDLHSEYRDKLTNLMYIRLAIDVLKSKNIPFLMTYLDDLLFDQQWHTSPAVIGLQEYIRPHMTTFDGHSFLEWSRINGYPETQQWHPTEPAHLAAGNYMIKVFDKQKISGQAR